MPLSRPVPRLAGGGRSLVTPLTRRRQPWPRRLCTVALTILGAGLLPLQTAHAQGATGPGPSSAPSPGPAGGETRRFDIPAGPLGQALDSFARSAGINLFYESQEVDGLNSGGLAGTYTAQQGLAALLQGSGLEIVPRSGGYTLRRASVAALPPDTTSPTGAGTLPPVVVTADTGTGGDLPRPAHGGQVARGGRLGLLGNLDLMDTPFSQTSFTEQSVRNEQARTVTDVLANDPSVRGQWSDMSYTTAPMVRGFLVSPWDFSLNGAYGVLPGLAFSADSAERIEVLHGPSTLLNGMPPLGSVGGTINVVPKRAQARPITRLTAGLVSSNQIGASVDIGRRFGPDQRLGVRVNAGHSDGDTRTRNQSQRATAVSIGADYTGERVRFGLDLGYQDRKTQSPMRPTYLNAGVPVPAAPQARANWFQPWTYAHARDTYGALRGEFDLTEDWTAHAVYGARKNASYLLTGFGRITAGNGDLTEAPYNFPIYHDSDSQEIGLRGRFNTGALKHQLAFAVNRVHDESGSLFPVIATISSNLYNPTYTTEPAYPRLQAPRTSAIDLTSVGFTDTLSTPDERFRFIWGLRQQRITSRSFAAATGDQTALYGRSATTPSVAVVFRPRADLSVYASYIEGLQAGTVVAANYANAGTVLPPYVSRQIETGVKIDWGTLTSTFALFQITQASGSADAARNVFSADGRQRNRGLEWNNFGEVARGIRILGGLTLLDGRLVRTAGGTYDGNQAPSVPHIQANLGAEWDPRWMPGLTLTGRAIATSGQYYDTANTQRIPGWARFDIGARYAFQVSGRAITIRANVLNVADRGYWAGANPTYGLSIGSPRTVLVSATVDL